MFETSVDIALLSVDIALLSYVMKSRAAKTHVHKLDSRGNFEDAIQTIKNC